MYSQNTQIPFSNFGNPQSFISQQTSSFQISFLCLSFRRRGRKKEEERRGRGRGRSRGRGRGEGEEEEGGEKEKKKEAADAINVCIHGLVWPDSLLL